MLVVRGVHKAFGGVQALTDVALTVWRGTIHGLIGPNGAGKTTLVNVITGIYAPDAGTILYRGQDITSLPAHLRARLGLRRTFQNPHLPRHMTVLEAVLVGAHTEFTGHWLQVACGARDVAQQERRQVQRALDLIQQVGIGDVWDEQTSNIPYGKQRMAELAWALLGNPELLILDEPAAGLSEQEIGQLAAILTRLKSSGVTILIIEHNMDFLLELVDRVTVLDFGKVIFDGDPESLQRDRAVEEAYLGGAALA